MLQSLTKAKMMVSPQTDSRLYYVIGMGCVAMRDRKEVCRVYPKALYKQ